MQKLKIVHCFRSPVGGLFRHVCDLVRGQAASGYSLGVICDSSTGDQQADQVLADLAALCDLGMMRIPMTRTLGLSDLNVHRQIKACLHETSPDIVHGHGAKGGAYARLAANRSQCKTIYTPHGGSLHYSASNPVGMVYLGLERYLKGKTDGQIFESQYGADVFTEKLGQTPGLQQVIYNGLSEEEFKPIESSDEYDFVFVGELRKLKGIDVLLDAISLVKKDHKHIKVMIAGQGPDKEYFQQRISTLGITSEVTLSPPVYPATVAFAKGRCVVMPSLAESFPYIVLETVAAACPIIATNVGGIPEIFGEHAHRLIPPGNVNALIGAMNKMLQDPDQNRSDAYNLQLYVKENFNQRRMVEGVISFYQQVLKG